MHSSSQLTPDLAVFLMVRFNVINRSDIGWAQESPVFLLCFVEVNIVYCLYFSSMQHEKQICKYVFLVFVDEFYTFILRAVHTLLSIKTFLLSYKTSF